MQRAGAPSPLPCATVPPIMSGHVDNRGILAYVPSNECDVLSLMGANNLICNSV